MMPEVSFSRAIGRIRNQLREAPIILTERWQGIKTKPEMATHEILHSSFTVQVQTENLAELAEEIGPNLPWADRHFELERVSGHPLNPGTTWKEWPYALRADKFRDENEQFNHSYAERYWPKHAGMTPRGELTNDRCQNCLRPYVRDQDGSCCDNPKRLKSPIEEHYGIRNFYGDLNDVIDQLVTEPNTRQAYIPIFFPEDTGGAQGGRVPCTLGYHLIHRHGQLHLTYYLRSCDFLRHFRDDIYLTVRLQLWILDRLREKDPKFWGRVTPGMFTMHITSMHLFVNDYINIFGRPFPQVLR